MNLVKLEFKPGLIEEDTPLAAEGGFVDANLIRFRQGRAEVEGGWTKFISSLFTGIARGAKAWADLAGETRIAFGTQAYLYAVVSGTTLRDMTPKLCDSSLLPPNPFASNTSGSLGTCTVTHPGHGLLVGESVTIAQAQGGGSTNPAGTYTVQAVHNPNEYTITATGSGGGSAAVATAVLPAGPLDASGSTHPRTWSVDNFGEFLVACPQGRKIFIGPIENSAPSNINVGTWVASANWTGSGANISLLAPISSSVTGNMSQNVVANFRANRAYKITFSLTTGSNCTVANLRIDMNTTNGLVNLVPLFTVVAVTGGSYSFNLVAPADVTDIVFYGEVTNTDISAAEGIVITSLVFKENEISPIDTAPGYNDVVFVDPSRFIVSCGTVGANGEYSSMLVRWSDQDNFRSWVPSDTNLAGEIPLSNGTHFVGALVTRQQNILFTDAAMFSMQFTGSSTDVFSFRLLATGCGLIARHAATDANGIVFFMSNNQNFYIFQGSVPQIIDCPLRADVFGNLNTAQQSKIYCGYNAAYNEVVWFYPRGAATECSHYVKYNYVENHWTHGAMDRTSWIPVGVYSNPIGFDTAGHIYLHESGTKADGAYLPWTLTTAYFDIQDGNNILAVRKYMTDFSRQVGQFSFTINFRYWPNGPEFSLPTKTITTSTKELNFLRSARQMQLKWFNDTGDTNEFVRWGVEKFDVMQSGAQR